MYAIRYMDDVALFADDRMKHEAAREQVHDWPAAERHLTLKDPKARVRSTRKPSPTSATR